jgi:four helix bundle protein
MKGGIENLKIYKLAERLEVFLYKVTKNFPSDEKYRSVDQLRRSSSSVTDNISEAYHRYHYKDKINKLCIARGEAGETRSGITKAHKKGFVSKEITNFTYEKYTELIKGINGYIRYLRNRHNLGN